MAKIHKLSPDQLREARRAGFKKKQPKKPKRNAGMAAMENYILRHNAWVSDAKRKISEQKKKDSLRKQIYGH